MFKTHVKKNRENVRKAAEKKLSWLKEKWKPKPVAPSSEIRGIQIQDCQLDANFDSKPREYGGIQINDEERQLLKLPPKFGIFGEININDCIIETEKSLNQIKIILIF